MTTIQYEINGKVTEIEVTEEFAKAYAELEKEEARIERKETRRHQSLDKSLDNGFDIVDESLSLDDEIDTNERDMMLWSAINQLSDSQKQVFLGAVLEGMSMTEIGAKMGISQQSVSAHFYRAQKKLKKLLEK